MCGILIDEGRGQVVNEPSICQHAFNRLGHEGLCSIECVWVASPTPLVFLHSDSWFGSGGKVVIMSDSCG